MKKFLWVIPAIILIFAIFFLRQRNASPVAAPVVTPSPAPAALPPISLIEPPLTPTPSTTPPPTPTPSPTASGAFKNGSYTGLTADAIYGPIQVKAVVSGGKLTDVQFLQYPNDREHSVEVSDNALPILKTEAIQIQGSNVDNVSGATQTSDGFRVTLADALSQAH